MEDDHYLHCHQFTGWMLTSWIHEGSGPLPLQFSSFLGLLLSLGQDLSIFSSRPVLLSSPSLKSKPVSLPLQHDWSHQSLDLGGLVFLLLAFLQGQRSLDHILTDIIVLLQVEELSDLACSLGSQPPGDGIVGKSGNLVVSLLDNGQVKNSQVSVNNTSTDRFALTLSITSWSVAAVTLV